MDHIFSSTRMFDQNDTSIGVSIFFSLILSYFCFLVPAFNPCQGRLKNRNEVKVWLRFIKKGGVTWLCVEPSPEKIHKHISKRFQIISSALLWKQNSITISFNINFDTSKHNIDNKRKSLMIQLNSLTHQLQGEC